MKHVVAVSLAALALAACNAGGLDQGSRDGSSDAKSLSRPTAAAPRGIMHPKHVQPMRNAPTANAPAGAHLTNYGGNIIETPTYTNVYWGAYWTSGTGLTERQHYNGYTQTAATSADFQSVLAEYTGPGGKSIHNGVYAGEKLISTEPGKTIDDTQIQSTIQSWVNAGLVPAPSPDALYVLYFPPGTSITMGTDGSCTTFCGYHSTIQTTSGSGGLIRYIIIPHPDCGGCQFEGTVQDSVTVVASHEMSEAATDPDVGLATSLGPPLGWYDNTNGEIGDICAGDPNATLAGYRVQTEWSNKDNKCEASRAGTTPSPDFSVTVAPPSQTVTAGNSTTYTVVATPANGFSGSISWSVSGLPSGAKGSFSGSGNSQTLSVAAGTSTASGTYTLTVTGASGSLSHSATAMLVVGTAAQPDFALGVSPAALTIGAGKSGSSTASISASGGFNSGVSLAVSGLPTGVTGSFSPASVTGSGSSTLTLAVAAGAPAGSSKITVTGTAGALSHSATVNLTVTAAAQPDFSVSVAPGSVSVAQGSSSHATLSVGATNGFTGNVVLSASGAPSGVTVTFSSASVSGQGSSDVAVAASSSAAAGTYTVTLTGSSGAATHSVTLGVTVKANNPGNGVVFSDDAEDGNIGWSIGSQYAGDPVWAIETSAASHSGNHRWRSNPGRNYVNDTMVWMVSPAFSLAGKSKATLKFMYKFETEDYYDNFYVWVSGDDGQTFTKIAQGSGQSQGWNGWAPQASLDLSKYAGKSKVRIAFTLQSDYSVTDWGVALDDISVTAQ